MKFTNTLALIAATMAALPTTEAVKLKQDIQSEDDTKQLINFIFDRFDENGDGLI